MLEVFCLGVGKLVGLFGLTLVLKESFSCCGELDWYMHILERMKTYPSRFGARSYTYGALEIWFDFRI